MLRILLISIFILLSNFLVAQELEIYSIVKLQLDEPTDINILLDLGIAADHVHFDHPGFVELFVNQREKSILKENGFVFQELIANTKLYADKLAQTRQEKALKSSACGLDSFQLGSIGGYHDYEEVKAILQKINNDFPKITKLTTLGQSHEGRDIVALKISDNAAVDESATESAAYYDALTHAREPLSMMSTLYYISWLLENYSDPNELAKYYIDNRELHFILVVNPDGYIYNTEMAPNGGGGWRKNRRIINNDCVGVDINRNYNAQWEGPGSHSLEPCSDIYRGETPNSEVETQIIQSFIDEIKPKSAFSSHSYSQVMIDPNKKVGNPDYNFGQYAGYSSEFTPARYKGYGSADDLIGYLASGTTLDYLFEQGTVAWSPEIGTRFWEAPENICYYVQEMLEPMKFISKIAGEAPSYHNHIITSDQKLINGNTVELSINIINKGLSSSQDKIIAELIPLGAETIVQNERIDYLPTNFEDKFYEQTEKFRLEIVDAEIGNPILFELRIFKNNILTESKEISLFPGDYNILFEDDFEADLQKWTQSSNKEDWSITDIDSKSGNKSLVDSKFSYASETVSVIQLSNSISLKERLNPWLFFNIKYGLNTESAQMRVLISQDDINWRPIKTDGMSISRNGNSFTGHSYWTQEAVNLSAYVDNYEELYLRFELTTQQTNNTSDGVYIDDVKVLDFISADATSPNIELITADDIRIYPNPTSGQIYIKPINIPAQNMAVVIYNALGQKIKSYNQLNSAKEASLDIGEQATGQFIIQLQIGDRSINKKIFKTDFDR